MHIRTRFSPDFDALEDRSLLATIFDVDTGLIGTPPPNTWMLPYSFATGSHDFTVIHSHGTYIAGLFASTEARWGRSDRLIDLPALDPDGTFHADAVAAALTYVRDYARANPTEHVAVAMPLSGPGSEVGASSIIVALDSLAFVGVPVSIAAGNASTDTDVTPYWPGSASIHTLGNVLTVAATDSTGALQSYSNWGVSTVQAAVRVQHPDGTSGASLLGTIALAAVEDASPRPPKLSAVAYANDVVKGVLAGVTPSAALAGKVATGGELVDVSKVRPVEAPSPVSTRIKHPRGPRHRIHA